MKREQQNFKIILDLNINEFFLRQLFAKKSLLLYQWRFVGVAIVQQVFIHFKIQKDLDLV